MTSLDASPDPKSESGCGPANCMSRVSIHGSIKTFLLFSIKINSWIFGAVLRLATRRKYETSRVECETRCWRSMDLRESPALQRHSPQKTKVLLTYLSVFQGIFVAFSVHLQTSDHDNARDNRPRFGCVLALGPL